MFSATADCKTDLLRSLWLLPLWVLPVALIIIGSALGPVIHTAFWTAGFAIIGGACMLNAHRCGRRHCYYTGLLYLLAALACLLYGVGAVQLGVSGWDWIAGIAFGACVIFCCVLEPALGKYVAAR